MLKQLKPQNIFISIAILIITLVASDFILNIRTKALVEEKYSYVANEIKTSTKSYIDAKSEAILFIALSLANDHKYIDAIKHSRIEELNLDSFSKELQKNTAYKNIWIQISDMNGISVYRSWTKKRGDDLKKIRKDIVQMLKDPKIKSTISTGLFDMTFKAMVPIFDNKKFMGTIDVVAKFNSVANQLKDIGFEPVILVDKSYKKQIKKPFTKMFIDDYYIANLNASYSNQQYIKTYGIEKLINNKNDYITDSKNNKFITIYKQKDVLGKDMGYFVLFHPLDTIDLGYIYFYHNSILAFIFLLVIGIFLIILLINSKHYKEKTELQNKLLSKEVEEKNTELEQQHAFLQNIINGINESIMVIDKDFNVLLANDYAKRFSSKSIIKDLNNPKCYEMSHHQDHPCEGDTHPCPLTQTFEKNKSVQMIHRHLTPEGEEHYIELSTTPLYNKDNELYAIVELGHNITEHLNNQKLLEEQKNELDYQAHYDSLTLLPNRVLFADRLKRSIKTAQRYKNHVALLFIDLDHFKEINDSLGHDAGDYILQETAKRLQSDIRKSDTVSRLGGDEFTMILEGIHNINEIVDLVQKILHKLQQPYKYKDNKLYSAASIGISVYPENGDTAQELLKNADAAMYKAKENGRNTYSFYTQSMTQKAYERVVIETKLREAIKNKEFRVYYQPQINLTSKSVVGFEALVRWFDPDGSIISPNKFIPIAEQTGLIIDIGKIILESVFLQAVQWQKDGRNFDKIAINISTKQLKDHEFLSNVKDLLDKTNCDPSLIEFEITESFFIEDINEAVNILNDIKNMNISISLDDFGTGFSSLSYLKQLPISKLKIDKSFIDDIFTDDDDKTITQSIINLAKNMNLKVIAEGVETKEQEKFLEENGCELVQGFLYSKPLHVDKLKKFKYKF
ncbi:EAL domain-containing protein [Sulfurimonas sp.]|uniref:EAL domain-containing protein n=1 Tax=Sulfurimonas sp. TaxID=2022749 RepID=UPI0035670C09